jgi:hypothetical protein
MADNRQRGAILVVHDNAALRGLACEHTKYGYPQRPLALGKVLSQ